MEFKSKSSNISKFKYNKEKKVLEVTFKTGVTYEYHGVGETDFSLFKDSKSQGSHLHSKIKNKFKSKLKE